MSMPAMSMPAMSMRVAALLLSLAISACVTFERAPVAQLSGDPAKDSVFIARDRIDGDNAWVWLADPDEAMRPPAKGRATGVRLDESNVHVKGRRAAIVIAKLLRARGDSIFAGQQDGKQQHGKGIMRLQRVAAAAAP